MHNIVLHLELESIHFRNIFKQKFDLEGILSRILQLLFLDFYFNNKLDPNSLPEKLTNLLDGDLTKK